MLDDTVQQKALPADEDTAHQSKVESPSKTEGTVQETAPTALPEGTDQPNAPAAMTGAEAEHQAKVDSPSHTGGKIIIFLTFHIHFYKSNVSTDATTAV